MAPTKLTILDTKNDFIEQNKHSLGLQTEEDLQREVIYFSTICDFCETRGG
jgi:hypothetical protein